MEENLIKGTRMMEAYVALFRQLIDTGAQSLKFIRQGKPRIGFYWFLVRNYISFFENRNNSRRSTYARDGFSLSKDCFAQLPTLSANLSDELVNHFLEKAPGETKALSFTAYCDYWRSTGVVRPTGIDLSKNTELIAAVFSESGLIEIVCEHLGLKPSEIVFNARIDTLIRLSVDRKILGNYDDALEIHRDIDSLKFVKAFFYLNAVGEGSGHHEVYIGSHRNLPLPLKLIRRYTEADLVQNNIPVNLKKVTGMKGYGFIENTTAFHRGTIPTTGDRIMMAICFNDRRSTLEVIGYEPLLKP